VGKRENEKTGKLLQTVMEKDGSNGWGGALNAPSLDRRRKKKRNIGGKKEMKYERDEI